MLTQNFSILSVACFLVVLLLGCGSGDGLDRQAVSGTITWNTTPLEWGVIRFEPIGENATTPAEATIENGKYTINRNEGPVPGEYRVLIFSPERQAGNATLSGPPGGSLKPAQERIPPYYNTRTTLRETISPDKENLIDFNLVSGGK